MYWEFLNIEDDYKLIIIKNNFYVQTSYGQGRRVTFIWHPYAARIQFSWVDFFNDEFIFFLGTQFA